jgi:lysozyme family protein
MSAFEPCLAVVLREEGGFSNNPRDPGGMTNLGVTRAVWEAWTKRPASEADMRGLTPALVAPLYRANYWQPPRCDDLPPALALCVFDFAVNAGAGRAARFLQRIAGVASDGLVGPATLAAVNARVASAGVAPLVRAYMIARRDYYRQCQDFPSFGDGWLNRVDYVETQALRMIP